MTESPKLKATDLETLPIFQGFGLWYFGTRANALGFAGQGWEIADGTVSTSDPSYTKPNQTHGKFVQGSTTPNTDGGVAQHYHTIADHSHGNTSSYGVDTSQWTSYNTSTSYPQGHYHTTSNLGATASLYASDNNPLYVAPIPMVYCLSGAGSGHGLPRLHDMDASCFDLFASAIGWTEASTYPSNYYVCDGTNGTPNLIGKFLRGIASGAGSNNGGSDHTHYTEHNHDGSTSAPSSGVHRTSGGDRQENWPSAQHVHSLSNTQGITSSGVAGGTANLVPPYRTLKFVMFTLPTTDGPLKPWDLDTSISRIPSGLAVAKHTDGAPSNYSVIGLSGHHLMHAGAGADYTSGGSSSGSHSHGGDAHAHGTGGAIASTTDVVESDAPTPWSINDMGHAHTTPAASWTRVDAANNEPPAVNVLFCQRN